MGLQSFQIFFDNPYGVYYGGQQLVGNVKICLTEPKKARAITIQIQGLASVQWEETRSESYTDSSGNSQTRTVTDVHSSTELYFKNELQLWGGGDSGVLGAGEFNFPFNCVLPYNIPSSYEGNYGQVRYTVRAIINRPWKFNHEAKALFTVICPLDLNMYPALMEPIQKSAEKTFCCWCCASGPLSVILSLPSGGVVSGELILPTVEVDNASRVNISNIELSFVRRNVYKAEGSTKVEEISIREKKLGRVNAHDSKTLARNEITIPPLPPSNLANCNIIDVTYCVKVRCNASGAHQDFTLLLPVTLGTVPFRSHFNDFSASTTQPPIGWNLAPSAPSFPEAGAGIQQYPDLPPPSYNEAVSGGWSVVEKDDNEYVIGDKTYNPRYPVYSITNK